MSLIFFTQFCQFKFSDTPVTWLKMGHVASFKGYPSQEIHVATSIYKPIILETEAFQFCG
jgi:hypothetical protein